MLTHSQNAQKGFTLVELIIVIALIGFLAAASLGSFIDSSGTFSMLANFQSFNSSIRTMRNYAVTNKAVYNNYTGLSETPDRFGLYVTDSAITAFADDGKNDLKYDENLLVIPEDSFFPLKSFNFEDYTIKIYDGDQVEITPPVTLFYESNTGELTAFKEVAGVNELLPKTTNKFLIFEFSDNNRDLTRYTILFLISGLPEEFTELPT